MKVAVQTHLEEISIKHVIEESVAGHLLCTQNRH